MLQPSFLILVEGLPLEGPPPGGVAPGLGLALAFGFATVSAFVAFLTGFDDADAPRPSIFEPMAIFSSSAIVFGIGVGEVAAATGVLQ